MHYVELLAFYMRLPAFNYRIIALSVIAAIAMLITLLALAPSLAQGATTDVPGQYGDVALHHSGTIENVLGFPPCLPAIQLAGKSAPVARLP